MSFCAVNMQKYKSNAVGGLQSHNRRDNFSTKNREIDYNLSHLNYDLIDPERRSYASMIKDRIASLDLKRAVRHDAVTYCSFIVSSDQGFFYKLGEEEHISREYEFDEMVAHGFREPADFDEPTPDNPAYQRECMADASRPFFEDATRFFVRRFGKENVTNATVHVDEIGAIHMHLGVIPVTPDGRLSAKKLFTPESLRDLQTAFAEEVGAKWGLERGREGSDAEHLDELSYKIARREEDLELVEEQLKEARQELESDESSLKNIKAEVKSAREEKAALSDTLAVLNARIEDQHEEIQMLDEAIKEKNDEGELRVGMATWQQRIAPLRKDLKEKQAMRSELNLFRRFIEEVPGVKQLWQMFLQGLAQRQRKKPFPRLNNDEQNR